MKWIIIAVVIIVIIVAVAGGSKSDKPKKVGDSNNPSLQEHTTSENDSGTQEENKEAVFRVGETAELKDVQVAMTDYQESTGSEFNKPSEGNVFVLVEFEIVNYTDSKLVISSMMSSEAYADDYALSYSLSAMIDKNGNPLYG